MYFIGEEYQKNKRVQRGEEMISRFICEVCKWEYNNADSATTCENQHRTLEKNAERKRIDKLLETVEDEMDKFEEKYEECYFADCEKCDECTFFDEDDFCDCDCENCDDCDDCEEVAESEKPQNDIVEGFVMGGSRDANISLSFYGSKYFINGKEVLKEDYDDAFGKCFLDWN